MFRTSEHMDWSKIDLLTMILPSVKLTNNLLHIRIVAFQASGDVSDPLLTFTNSLEKSSQIMPGKIHD